MRAMVTGCAGFIGSHLTESLLVDGHSVLGVDCFNDNYGRAQKLDNLAEATEWDAFEFVPTDLARGDLSDLVDECDIVFHLAAEPGVRTSWGARFELYLRNNVLATQQLLETARSWPEKRFIYASSSSIYGDAETLPTPETAIPRPLSPYGTTKLAGEHLCHLYRANHGVDAVVLRYFSVYGPRQRPDMAFAAFCHAALRREPVTIHGDGGQTRDFTFVTDVVAATRSAAERGASGATYNVGGGSRTSLGEAVGVVSELAGEPVEVEHAAHRHGDARDTAADITLARADLGYEPQTVLRDGLQAQFEWAAARSAASRRDLAAASA